jgi:lysophospholipase L1-like esterase
MNKWLANLLVCCFLLQNISTGAQDNLPFWNEIQNFKRADSSQPPPGDAILFVGSSSFRLWKNIEQAFPNHTVINRGFGGSSLPDVIRYADDIIFTYQPKQVVIYCGENDLAASDTVTGETVNRRFQTLFSMIRKMQPGVPVVFVSIKPSPSRWHLKTKVIKANLLIKKFLATKRSTRFVDVWTPMLNKAGQPRAELFVEDRLHMNDKGYAIWQQLIEPRLLR